MPNTLKRFLISLSLLVLGVQAALAGDVFRFRLPADPLTFDWTKAATTYETYVLMNIMEGLVELDRDLNAVPALAESWTVSEDGRTYTFKLRPEVKWTDGIGLTAHDFIYSWKRLLLPSNKNDYASFLFDIDKAEAFHAGRVKNFDDVGVKALDGRTIQIKLRRVVPYFVTLLSFWVTFPQREDLIKKNPNGWMLPPALVTLGPFRIADWKRGQELRFERNPSYYGKAPALAGVQAVVETDDAKARQLLFDKKIDALLEVSTEDILKYAADAGRGWSLKQFPYLSTVFVAFNTAAAPTSNVSLRKAVALALDRARIPAFLKGGQMAADSLIPKGLAGYDPSVTLTPAPAESREALRAAGYKDAAKVPQLTVLATSGAGVAAAEYVAETLKANLGLRLNIVSQTPKEFREARRKGKFHLFIAQWGADYPDASSFMELMLSTGGNNQTRWKNPEYDRLVREAAGQAKFLERLKMYSEAQRILMQEHAVVIPLYYPKLTALVSNSVASFDINPLNYLFFKRISLK